ncbi:hypothetical protein PFISCL1PPCAC_17070, partial [Pristionchus fissidentatus]
GNDGRSAVSPQRARCASRRRHPVGHDEPHRDRRTHRHPGTPPDLLRFQEGCPRAPRVRRSTRQLCPRGGGVPGAVWSARCSHLTERRHHGLLGEYHIPYPIQYPDLVPNRGSLVPNYGILVLNISLLQIRDDDDLCVRYQESPLPHILRRQLAGDADVPGLPLVHRPGHAAAHGCASLHVGTQQGQKSRSCYRDADYCRLDRAESVVLHGLRDLQQE